MAQANACGATARNILAAVLLIGGNAALAAGGSDDHLGLPEATLAGMDEEAVCESGQGEECEESLSLRQLRGEMQVAKLHQQEDDDTTTTAEPDDTTDEDSKYTRSCKAAHHYCMDYMSYRSREECADDSVCRVVDVSSVGGKEGAGWLCAPAHAECEAKYEKHDFMDADHKPPEEFAADPNETSDEEDALEIGKAMQADAATDAGRYHIHRRRGIVPRRRYQNHNTNNNNNPPRRRYDSARRRYDEPPRNNGVPPPPPPPWRNDSFHGTKNMSNIMTLYHTTSKSIADKIVANGFRPGWGGWCSGAIYLLNHPHLPKSKYSPKTTKTGAILQANVSMGKMAHMNNRCRVRHNGRQVFGASGARRSGYNSLVFEPPPHDGDEYVIWDTQQVLSVQIYEYMF